jgi:hypothetical protein
MVTGTYSIVNHCWPCRVGDNPSTVGPAGECYTPTPLRRKSFFPGHYEVCHFSPDITKFVIFPRTLRSLSFFPGHYEVCHFSPDRAVGEPPYNRCGQFGRFLRICHYELHQFGPVPGHRFPGRAVGGTPLRRGHPLIMNRGQQPVVLQ